MLDRFLTLSANISQAYKYMTKIKSHYMTSMGLKAAHVMCLLHIGFHEEGLTPVELSTLCAEDKAAVSKNLAALKSMGLIWADDENSGKVYRIKYRITEKGRTAYREELTRLHACLNDAQEDARRPIALAQPADSAEPALCPV